MMVKYARILCTVAILYVCEKLITANAAKEYETTERAYPLTSSEVIERNFSFIQDKLNWTDARDACKEKGMALVTTPNLEAIWYLIYSIRYYDIVPKNSNASYWVGFRRKSKKHRWVWETEGKEINRYDDESNDINDENCIEMIIDPEINFRWNQLACNILRGYICEGDLHVANELKEPL